MFKFDNMWYQKKIEHAVNGGDSEFIDFNGLTPDVYKYEKDFIHAYGYNCSNNKEVDTYLVSYFVKKPNSNNERIKLMVSHYVKYIDYIRSNIGNAIEHDYIVEEGFYAYGEYSERCKTAIDYLKLLLSLNIESFYISQIPRKIMNYNFEFIGINFKDYCFLVEEIETPRDIKHRIYKVSTKKLLVEIQKQIIKI